MKIHPALAALGLALSLAGAGHAQAVQGLDGDWQGDLEIGGGAKLTVVFHIATTGEKTKVTLDSPDQGAMGIPVAGVTRDGQKVAIDVQAVAGAFDGALSADGKSIAGVWSQSGASLPLTLTKK
jgi:hypothetical protein